MHTFSIRTHLLLLVLTVSVPLVATVGFVIYSDMQQTIAYTKTSLRTLASTMVNNTGGKIDDARQILERLSVRPLVRRVDPKNCDGVLKELHSLNPGLYGTPRTQEVPGWRDDPGYLPNSDRLP